MTKEAIIKLLNQALELEHAAEIQYLAHAELIDGLYAEPIISRLKEIAEDEHKHAAIFRELIGGILGGTPIMSVAKTYPGKEIRQILEQNLKNEKEAIDMYTKILEAIYNDKKNLPYEFHKLEHDVRSIIMDEQEHVSELKLLLAKR
ncbi:MAG: ferritin-like domain-containing protein [Candidatus Pacearchaeota archaeon]